MNTLQCIEEAREILDSELTALAGESYNRAYSALVNCQMLAELEEVIYYKLMPERRPLIKQAWWDRLQVYLDSNYVLSVKLPDFT